MLLAPSELGITDIVAIDGPAGAGKSSVARRVASALGYAYLDTGAMYRAATWWALHECVSLDDADALTRAVRAMPLELEETNGKLLVRVDGTDVTEAIRRPDVTERIRKLDGIPGVRAHLVELQRRFGAREPTVVEGRDIGTVVFPYAKCKIFLDASLDERARRRALQLRNAGQPVEDETLRHAIHIRDENDRNRAAAPLRPADDAYLLDTTGLTMDEVVDRIVARAKASA